MSEHMRHTARLFLEMGLPIRRDRDPMRRAMIHYPIRETFAATEDDLTALTSRVANMERGFGNSIRDLTDRIERIGSRLQTIDVHVGDLLAQAHADRMRTQTPQVNVVMPGPSASQSQSAEIDLLNTRLRRQEQEMDQLRDRLSTVRSNLEKLQDNVGLHRRTFEGMQPEVERLASEAAEQRFARIVYNIPPMIIAGMVSEFQPPIQVFQIPQFQPLPRIQTILNRAIDGFRAPLIGHDPQLRLTFDPPAARIEEDEPPDDDGDAEF